jgi:hypothetical protein
MSTWWKISVKGESNCVAVEAAAWVDARAFARRHFVGREDGELDIVRLDEMPLRSQIPSLWKAVWVGRVPRTFEIISLAPKRKPRRFRA